jgi:intein-encoded DNA endonuclease-like protein
MLNVRKNLKDDSMKRICELYKKGESTCTLSKKFGIAHTTIFYHLKKNHVNLRSKSEALKIGFKFGRVKIRKHEIPNSSKKLTPQKGYLLGVICGDGYIDFDEKRRRFQVSLQTIDKEFALEFGNSIKHIYKINPSLSVIKPPKGKNWSVKYQMRVCSKNVCLDILNYGVFKTENWKVPFEIKKSNSICKLKFLQGFYDSEGDVDEKYNRVGLTSTNLTGLQEIQSILNEFSIRSSLLEQKTYGNRKHKFVLRIQDRKSIEIFNRKIKFMIKRRQKALRGILKKYKLYKTLKEKITKLKPKMIELRSKGYSYGDISKELNLSIATVWRHLKEENRLTP